MVEGRKEENIFNFYERICFFVYIYFNKEYVLDVDVFMCSDVLFMNEFFNVNGFYFCVFLGIFYFYDEEIFISMV